MGKTHNNSNGGTRLVRAIALALYLWLVAIALPTGAAAHVSAGGEGSPRTNSTSARMSAATPAGHSGPSAASVQSNGTTKLTGSGRIVDIPGEPGEKIDSRILEDVLYLKRAYRLDITDGYSTSSVHSAGGEHPVGLAIDAVPDVSAGGSWDYIDRLAAWAEPAAEDPGSPCHGTCTTRPPFRWVGYNGDAKHGRGHHIHLSWMWDRKHRPIAEWVLVLPRVCQYVGITAAGPRYNCRPAGAATQGGSAGQGSGGQARPAPSPARKVTGGCYTDTSRGALKRYGAGCGKRTAAAHGRPESGGQVRVDRQLSAAGAAFIGRFEGFVPNPYNDPAGHCTIGYGHLIHRGRCDGSEPEEFRRGISEDRATTLLRSDAERFARAVDKLVTVSLTQQQFDALVSFTYNVGEGALASSTLLKRLNAGDYEAVPHELLKWVKGGRPRVTMPGLVRRREAEGALFRDGMHGGAAATGIAAQRRPQHLTRRPSSRATAGAAPGGAVAGRALDQPGATSEKIASAPVAQHGRGQLPGNGPAAQPPISVTRPVQSPNRPCGRIRQTWRTTRYVRCPKDGAAPPTSPSRAPTAALAPPQPTEISYGPVNGPVWNPEKRKHSSITCGSRYIPVGLKPESVTVGWTARTQGIVNIIRGQWFGFENVGGAATGVRAGHISDSYHYCGRAIDSFAPGVPAGTRAAGAGLKASWRLANWAAANAAALSVSQVIFYDRIWTPEGGRWRPYENSRSSKNPAEENTLQHRDHVHISVY